jgi:hypothetical protein
MHAFSKRTRALSYAFAKNALAIKAKQGYITILKDQKTDNQKCPNYKKGEKTGEADCSTDLDSIQRFAKQQLQKDQKYK